MGSWHERRTPMGSADATVMICMLIWPPGLRERMADPTPVQER